MAAPIPLDEDARLQALRDCSILDTPPEREFDGVVALAKELCDTPMALVSLVDRDRQWFKAKVGLDVSETPRDVAFCAHALLEPEPLVVRDAREDPRFLDNALVTADPHIRFYAGVPLRLRNGSTLGTLCVLDDKPRSLTSAQLDQLRSLAARVSSELELRRELALARQSAAPALCRDALPVQLGAVIDGKYRVERLLGRGGMGVVLACQSLVDARPVALKLLLPSSRDDPGSVERFAREARALLSLKSPHVARVLDVGNLPDHLPYIVVEYLEGEDLAQRLARRGRLPVGEALAIAAQVCDGLAEAHALGIVHRDIKPGNLFLVSGTEGEPHAKLLDFGVAKWESTLPDAPALTGVHTILGSPQYMSPEQMLESRQADARTDIWSLGVVLYEALTGAPPYTGKSPLEICVNTLRDEPPPLRSKNPEVPEAVAQIVMSCLQKDRERRTASARELRRALDAQGSVSAPASGRATATARPQGRSATSWAALVLFTLVLASLLVFVLR